MKLCTFARQCVALLITGSQTESHDLILQFLVQGALQVLVECVMGRQNLLTDEMSNVFSAKIAAYLIGTNWTDHQVFKLGGVSLLHA